MNDDLVYLMRELNKEISIGNRIYGEFSAKQKYNYIESPILYSLLIFENVTQNDIVNEYSLPKQTVNNIVKKYETLGIVELKVDQNDKRKKIISLTEKGYEYISTQLNPLINRENEAAKELGSAKLKEIIKSLQDLNKALLKAFKED